MRYINTKVKVIKWKDILKEGIKLDEYGRVFDEDNVYIGQIEQA